MSPFRHRAAAQLLKPGLQAALVKAKAKFVDKRAAAISELGHFPDWRARALAAKDRILAELDVWLERFEASASSQGTRVLWARDSAEACQLVLEVAKEYGVHRVVKSKSMVTEELGLNSALEAVGLEVVETDLGEYIIQLAGETPSHIIAPAVHKRLEEVADLFAAHHGKPRRTDIPGLAREAREVLRDKFLTAEMGISGANFLVAETGSIVLVTNEGNGRMVTSLPRVHVAIAGIEKLLPDLTDLATFLRLLPRSATGQPISNYVSLLNGPRRSGESEGPEARVVILVDNGRSALVGGPFQPMLRCIRCGACMNHCPIYQSVGGHAYGDVYPGPMGSLLTPLLRGRSEELAAVCTGCNQCGSVCPVGIPLPELMGRLHADSGRGRTLSLSTWAWLARHPRLYRQVVRLAARYLHWLADGSDRIRVLGLAPAWTLGRDLPAPAGTSFHERYNNGEQHP